MSRLIDADALYERAYKLNLDYIVSDVELRTLKRLLMEETSVIYAKDRPMMVTDRTGKCPACHADNFYTMYDMQDDSHYNYCAYCGQRLDWTEDNKRRGIKNDYQ